MWGGKQKKLSLQFIQRVKPTQRSFCLRTWVGRKRD